VFDISDLPHVARVTFQVVLAALLGGVLGFEREQKGKAAGLRTHMLVALGAALFVVAGRESGMDSEQVSRVIQGLVAGIGFLGAGAIVRTEAEGQNRGLTTAAGIWLTAAIGMTVGLGLEALAIVCTVLAIVILAVLPRLEKRIGSGPG
jgi:putative Mg2+ transporter-C (MgtC) family protein